MAPNNNSLEKQTWGTWEELLLACAVRRHGADSWDAVATEVRRRSSGLHLLLTPQSCRQKYLDLERRFNRRDDDGGDDPCAGGGRNIPWLDELKRLRVAELKSELERYDLSIVSLQSTVKRLKEEREQSSREIEKDAEKSDLDGTGGGEPAKPSPESFAREPESRDSQSVNESNSTDPKHENPETGRDKDGKEPEPAEPAANGSEKTGHTRKPAGEDSYNGSTETVAKESPARGVGDSAELGESVAESKGGGGGGSDVQSSVSLSMKKEPEPDEPDNEDQSPAIKRPASQSQPLADFLHVLRSHEFGPLFERRLHSQETTNYRELIRQHMDLENVGKRVEEGWYSGPNKFFRDLLLLLNNAIIFYGNKSPESLAAVELRKLVAKQMASQPPKSDHPSKNTKPAPPPPPHLTPPSASTKQGSGSGSGSVKPKISIPIAACRKRSSIATKPASGTEKKRELASLVDKKPIVADIKLDHQDKKPVLAGNAEEASVTKKRSRERSSTGGRNQNKNTGKNSDNNTRGGSLEYKVVVESEKKSSNPNTSTVAGKKQSAANFLNRMKTSTSSPDQPTKSVAAKPDTKKDQGSGKKGSLSSGKKQESPGKKRIGRPPKKVATPPPPTSGKRNREGGAGEVEGPRNAKKRARK